MDYQCRLQGIQRLLLTVPCDALLVEDKTNLYYLTGLELSAGKLLVHTHGAHLFVDKRYIELCTKKSPFPVSLLDASNFVLQLASQELSFIQNLAFDSDCTTYTSYQQLLLLGKKLEEMVPARTVKLVPVEGLVKQLRTIKEPEEIEILQAAADLGSKGYDFVLSILKEGITEQEVATELEIFWKRHGSKGVAFDPTIAFGSNSSMPHYRAGFSRLRKGDNVLIDIGVNYQHYHSDMTRVVYFGEPDLRLITIHEIVRKAQKAALDLCRPDITVGSLDAAARDFIASFGYKDQFIHSLGHGVGLEIHEYPILRNTPQCCGIQLKPGMVITIEPGIYLPGVGGVRLEDTIVITEDGYKNLTKRSVDPILL